MRKDKKQKIMVLFLIITVLSINNTQISVAQEKPELQLRLNDWTVETGEEFDVYVYLRDKNGSEIPVSGVMVYFDSKNVAVGYTGSNGRAWLTAPSEPGTCVIVANKSGYVRFTDEIKVIKGPAIWESPYFPIIIAVLFLISAIFFVNWREKKKIYDRANQISKEKVIQRFEQQTEKNKPSSKNGNTDLKVKQELKSYDREPVRSAVQSNPKVEEIRIRRPRKQKKVVNVDEGKDETEKIVSEKRRKRKDYDWFEGKDDVRYEIDKLTGKIDEEGVDKWFEGVDNIKEKIDKKVRKKDKKEQEEEEE